MKLDRANSKVQKHMGRYTDCGILYVVGQLRAGGLERQLCYLLETIDRKRFRPAVAVWRFREDDVYVSRLRQLKVPIYFPPTRTPGPLKLKWIRSVVRQIKPEVVHSYSFYTNFGAWYGAAATGAVAVGSVRSGFTRAIKESGSYLGRLCAHWPHAQIFNSSAASEDAHNCSGLFRPRRIFVVRNGLDLKTFAVTPVPVNTQLMILGVGSLTYVKRWDRLLNVASRLKEERLDFLVKIAGDGPLRDSLSKQATELGVSDRVEFLGHTNNIPDLLSQATLLAHTSESEGCPNVVMEAMACARPVVATEAGDAPFLIDNGKTGFIVGNGDDDALARRIATLLSSGSLCKRMGMAARAKAEREFNLDRLVEETLVVYRAAGWRAPLSALSQAPVLS